MDACQDSRERSQDQLGVRDALLAGVVGRKVLEDLEKSQRLGPRGRALSATLNVRDDT